MSANSRPIELDLKDRKILMELDFDARRTNAEIARRVGLSKQNVDYRIRALIKNGVITGFYPLINSNRLGLIYCRVLIRFNNLTEEAEAKLLDEMVRDQKFGWVTKFEGKYDIILGAWVKSISRFKDIVDELVAQHGPYIKDKVESICTKLIHYPSRYILDTAPFREIAFSEDDEPREIDATDAAIIKSLSGDARKPLVQVANELGLSAKVVAYRLRGMEKSGIISGWRANINNNAIGYTHYKVLLYLNNASRDNIRQLKGHLKSNPHIVYFVEEVGLWNFDIECMFRTNQDYFGFIRDIRHRFPNLIKEYETLIIEKTLKVSYFALPA